MDFMVADAEALPFKKGIFDGVVSVYLHHELPSGVRKKVIKESMRVLKASGFWGLLDSIQLGDDENLNWAIKEFPKTFHEPFFTDYIKKPLGSWMKESCSERDFENEIYLLNKVLYTLSPS